MRIKPVDALAQPRLLIANSLHEPVTLYEPEDSSPCGAGDRVPRVGVPREERARRLKGFDDFLMKHDGSDRRVAAAKPFATGDQVWSDTEVVHREIGARATESRDHLVGD